MNKTAIKNYAVWARNELITRVTRKAFEYGIDKDNNLSIPLILDKCSKLNISKKDRAFIKHGPKTAI